MDSVCCKDREINDNIYFFENKLDLRGGADVV